MTSLTANLILQKTRLQNLNHVKKLNVCGVHVDDISVLSSVPNLEVCALSVNNVSDLSVFLECPQIQELYLRKNAIDELDQILFLGAAHQLRVVNLTDNPVCNVPGYRQFTVAALPSLKTLDDVEVTEEEKYEASKAYPNISAEFRELLARPRTSSGSPRQPRNQASKVYASQEIPASTRGAAYPDAPASARPLRAAQEVVAAPVDEENNGYNGDDVPVGGGGIRARPSATNLRRPVTREEPRVAAKEPIVSHHHAKPAAAPAVQRPAAHRPHHGNPDAAMVDAVLSLLNAMTPEGRAQVRDHLHRLGA